MEQARHSLLAYVFIERSNNMKKHISKTVAVIVVLSMLFTPVLPVTALAMEDPLILSEGEISEPTKEA